MNLKDLLRLPRQELELAAQALGIKNPRALSPADVAEMLLPHTEIVAGLVMVYRARSANSAALYRERHIQPLFHAAVAAAFPDRTDCMDYRPLGIDPELDRYEEIIINAAMALCGSPFCNEEDVNAAHFTASARGQAALDALAAYLDVFAEE